MQNKILCVCVCVCVGWGGGCGGAGEWEKSFRNILSWNFYPSLTLKLSLVLKQLYTSASGKVLRWDALKRWLWTWGNGQKQIILASFVSSGSCLSIDTFTVFNISVSRKWKSGRNPNAQMHRRSLAFAVCWFIWAASSKKVHLFLGTQNEFFCLFFCPAQINTCPEHPGDGFVRPG